MRKIADMSQRPGCKCDAEEVSCSCGFAAGIKSASNGCSSVTASPSATSNAILEEIFYISSKRSCSYRVKLTERGLTLRKESNCGLAKTETILVEDIVGCRLVIYYISYV